jgi:hypothetical protein
MSGGFRQLAKQGERDPDRLCGLALKQLQSSRLDFGNLPSAVTEANPARALRRSRLPQRTAAGRLGIHTRP